MISTLTKPPPTDDPRLHLREDLRTLLPVAVLLRPATDTVDLPTWVLVSESLEASAHALSCHHDSGRHDVVAVLIGYAVKTAESACAALPAPSAEPQAPASAEGAGSAWLRLERSWLRLAAQLARIGSCDVELLAHTLHEQRCALRALQSTH